MTLHRRSSAARAMLWGAAVVGAVFAAVGVASRSILVLGRRGRMRLVRKVRSLRGFQTALLGNSRETVARVLGPPRATSLHTGAVATGATAYWQADVWYYPLAPGERAALAIHFKDDVAECVEVVAAPKG